jgi:hypothetical protein
MYLACFEMIHRCVLPCINQRCKLVFCHVVMERDVDAVKGIGAELKSMSAAVLRRRLSETACPIIIGTCYYCTTHSYWELGISFSGDVNVFFNLVLLVSVALAR